MALGKEQTLALYLSAGCFASFASYVHKVFAGVGGASLGAVSFNFHSKLIHKILSNFVFRGLFSLVLFLAFWDMFAHDILIHNCK